MQEYCPLCMKMGIKNTIKALQINFQEAIWMCEGETCEWPFGRKEFTFLPRIVGNIWSCYWDDHKPLILKAKEKNLPVTSAFEVSREENASKLLHTNHDKIMNGESTDIRDSNPAMPYLNDVIVQSSSAVSDVANTDLLDDKKMEENWSNKNNQAINNIKANMGNKKNNNEATNHGTKSNINIANENQSNIRSRNHIIKTEIFLPEEIQSKNNTSLKEQSDACNKKESDQVNLKVTTMEIAGFPPITLAYDTSSISEIPQAVSKAEKDKPESVVKSYNTNSIITDKNVSMAANNTNTRKRNIQFNKRFSDSKKYAKFNFSEIKKKITLSLENNKTNTKNVESLNLNTNSMNIECLQSDPQSTKQVESSNSDLNTCNNSSNDTLSLENTSIDPSINVDSLLNDFINSNYHNSQEINDDWIDSLLN